MTILGKFKKRKDRQKLVKVRSPGPQFKRRRVNSQQHRLESLPMSPIEQHLEHHNQEQTTDSIEISYRAAKEMEAEVNDLTANESKSATLWAIASALQGSRRVMDAHADLEERLHPLRHMTRKLGEIVFRASKRDDDSMKKRYALVNALNKVQRRPDSFRVKCSNWEEVKQHLSSSFEFAEEESENDGAAANNPLTESAGTIATSLEQRLQDLRVDYREKGLASIQKWKQVVNFGFLDTEKSELAAALDRDDEALDRKLAEAEREYEQATKKKHMDEFEERFLQKEREEEAKKRASSLMRDLTPDESSLVRGVMYGNGPPTEILAESETDTVQRQSIQTLRPGEWLGDEVIHYFYLMLARRDEEMCRNDPSRKRSHFFKSFFITKILNEGHANEAINGTYEYKNVKRWSKKVPGKDIFNLDKIIFPINQGGMHWMCGVIHMQKKRIQIYDSMGSGGHKYLQCLFKYVQDEHKDKKKCPMPDIDDWELVGTTSDTPRQRNGFDCGVFTCMFADFVSKECPLVFSQEHITQCRERIVLAIMKGKAII
ncbi:unnamed protein product [Cylindrotheca closterium]|uniref:Ubiquitin-like protease family profile domain-containing protein n=1 Tax=Cylindrotheca closterium TaxID=2856 RepID=A0AAD2CA41_9STRA|nr:unnamed protein product [Cylindrotheca closterium]